tara:strand:- start:164 stop:574 length:411 start_codon:yes stop_codon:yes gene_type:complete
MYFFSPLFGYLFAGTLKFIIRSIKYGKIELRLMGMGGMPSNHTTIVTTPLTLIIINEGIDHPLVGLGMALLVIVIIDALDLRRKISKHAVIINRLNQSKNFLRENIGHNIFEIIGGILTGILTGFIYSFLFRHFFG